MLRLQYDQYAMSINNLSENIKKLGKAKDAIAGRDSKFHWDCELVIYLVISEFTQPQSDYKSLLRSC